MSVRHEFQTPVVVCEYMVSMIPNSAKSILEPTPGKGNLVRAVQNLSYPVYDVTAPKNFFKMEKKRFDCVIMNPPFSSKFAFSAPKDVQGMKLGYHILKECMEMSDSVIALMPWFVMTDSDVRIREITNFGLKSITALPRKTFQYSRIQTCVLELEKNFAGNTQFVAFKWPQE